MNKADQFLPPFQVKWYRLPEYLKDINSYVTFSDLNEADAILSGGVVWTENELDFQSSELVYTIDNVKYIAPPLNLITLEPTQPGLDRIDVFYVDTSGELKVRQGQESADPSEPDIIEGEELKVSFVIIRDGQVVPDQVTSEKIYDENLQVVGGEWNTSTPDSSVNLASTVDAQTGSTAISFTIANFRDEVVFNNDVPISGTSIDTLVFRVKLTRPPRRRAPRLFVQVNNTDTSTAGPGVVINDGQYGFNASSYNAWQTIIIPASVLGVLGVNPDEVIIRNYRRGMSFFLDNILFQAGITTNIVIPEYTLDIVGDDLNLRKDDDIVSTVDLTTYAEPASGLEQVFEGGVDGWRFIGESAGDDVNRYIIGNKAIDAMQFDGTFAGSGDYPALPYGTASSGGINFGLDNKDNALYNSVIFGAANQTNAYANAFLLGNYLNAGYGYGDVLIGTYNTTVPTNVNSFLFALGHNVTVTSQFFAAGIGLALNVNARGQVAVGTSNVPWAGGVTAADRPAFTVGTGTTTTPSARWQPILQQDGFNVYFDGRVVGDQLTTAVIDAEATGRVLITREWYEAQPSGGSTERTAYINTSSGNDGSGELGNDTLPFKTLSAAHDALPTSEAERRQLWKIIYLNDAGIETITTSFQERNLLIAGDNFAGTINFDPASGLVFENPGSNIYNIEINLPKATLGSTNSSTNAIWTFDQGQFKITCDTFQLDNASYGFGYFRGLDPAHYELNFNLLTLGPTQGSIFGTNKGDHIVNIGKIEDNSNVTKDFGKNGIILEVGEYEKIGTGTMQFSEGGAYTKIKVGTFSGAGTGTVVLMDEPDSGAVTEIDFQGCVINTIGYSIIANVSLYGDYYFRGAMKTYGQGIQFRAGNNSSTNTVNFERFKGRSQVSISTVNFETVNFTDSHLLCTSDCMTASAGTVNDVNFYGVNSIVLDNPGADEVVFNATGAEVVNVYGSLHTNTATLGLNVTANVLTTNIYQ